MKRHDMLLTLQVAESSCCIAVLQVVHIIELSLSCLCIGRTRVPSKLDVPSFLLLQVVHIIELLAQQEVVLQHINREAPIGRAAILPALLSGPPPEAEPAAAAGAAADAAAAAGADVHAAAAAADDVAGGGADVHAAGANGDGEDLGVPMDALEGQQQEEEQEQQGGGVGPAIGAGLVGLQEPVLPAAAVAFLQHAWNDAINGEGDAAADFAAAGGDGGWGDDGEEAAGQLPPGWAPLEQGAAAAAAGGVDFAEVLMGMLVLEGQAADAQDE